MVSSLARFLEKKKVFTWQKGKPSQDFFCTPTRSPVYCFVHQYRPRYFMWKRFFFQGCLVIGILRQEMKNITLKYYIVDCSNCCWLRITSIYNSVHYLFACTLWKSTFEKRVFCWEFNDFDYTQHRFTPWNNKKSNFSTAQDTERNLIFFRFQRRLGNYLMYNFYQAFFIFYGSSSVLFGGLGRCSCCLFFSSAQGNQCGSYAGCYKSLYLQYWTSSFSSKRCFKRNTPKCRYFS